ncbi:MAG TPA: CHAT domain-containing protein [Pyrinomonadaceae bacterium]
MPEPNQHETQPGVLTIEEVIYAPAAQMRLEPPHEWLTPDGELNIIVNQSQGGSTVTMRGGDEEIGDPFMDWYGNSASLAGPISNVRKAAEAFRAATENYLNNINRDDLVTTLKEFAATEHKLLTDYSLKPEHQVEWEKIALTSELRKLAYFGFTLYETLFPKGSDLRAIVDKIDYGWRVNITWLDSDRFWVPHIPWGLLYRRELPPEGQPVDAEEFWGLRYRIEYKSHPAKGEKKSLGDLKETYRGCCLYWGDRQEADDVKEARWQQAAWAELANQIFVPSRSEAAKYKEELKSLLASPAPTPMRFLYLFCHCDVGDGSTPVLRFGSTNKPTDIIEQMDIGQSQLVDRPLVFVNACMSAGSGAYVANELEQVFFRRGCRAYIGTETKVPIQLASRFAYIFCQFFYRKMDEKPIAAGEAVYQTRQFLWHQYRNIGGLFYTYINQYELYMAREDELEALRRGKGIRHT